MADRSQSRLPLRPHRARIDVTFAARDQEDAGRILEAITDAVEPWAFFELASCEQMDDADVIPDSPLAEALNG